jgi:hypothetical protein
MTALLLLITTTWFLMLARTLCDAFVPPIEVASERHKQPALMNKRPKVADAAEEWPSDLPSWAQAEWTLPVLGSANDGLCANHKASVSNDAPTWELVLAKTIPPGGSVYPASAMLAPKGGCDNLCNDDERYTDTCEFQVSGHVDWLLVRTEDRQWSFAVLQQDNSH